MPRPHHPSSVPFSFLLILSMTLASILLGACHQRVVISHEAPTPQEELMSVRLDVEIGTGSLSLRAANPMEMYDNPFLTAFSGLRVVFYSLSESGLPDKVAYVFQKDIALSSKTGRFTGSDVLAANMEERSFGVTEMKVKPGKYHVFLFASPSDEIEEVTNVGSAYSELSKPILLRFEGGKFRSYTFSNLDTPVSLAPSASSDRNKPPVAQLSATLKSDFAFVSLQPQLSAARPGDEIGASPIRACADVSAKHFIPLPEWLSVSLSRSGSMAELRVPKDHTFTGFGSKPIEELQRHFEYLPEDFSSNVWTDFSKSDFIRLPENTQADTETLGTTITRLIIELNYAPKGIPTNTSWVSYSGRDYTRTDWEQMVASASTKAPESRTAFESRLLTDVETLKTKYGTAGLPDRAAYTDAIRYHHLGLSYYALPISLLGTGEQLGNQAPISPFGLIRNHFYILRIGKVHTPGACHPMLLDRHTDYKDLTTNLTVRYTQPTIVEADVEL